jgi:hypothetical protein
VRLVVHETVSRITRSVFIVSVLPIVVHLESRLNLFLSAAYGTSIAARLKGRNHLPRCSAREGPAALTFVGGATIRPVTLEALCPPL